MNIKEAKQEIKNTLRAYLKKDEFGNYTIPQVRKRPVLLIGAPGIGKTAIMEQIAQEEGLALLSYTMTHHTRQSAVGLPFIVKKEYGGREVSVTEYTMSEIIAEVYEKIEETGLSEGILFLDEINCVSETLAPTMLKLLQEKKFGSQSLPEGFLIVAAGNPPEYNKSVREFDIVTLDRVKYISVTEDFKVWKEYAYAAKVAPVILSYLELKRENFYRMEGLLGEKQFVTARGWQDLSELLTSYEALEIPVTEDVIRQYVQHDEIARDFFMYYELYKRYESLYRIKEVLAGADTADLSEKLSGCAFDEKISILGLLLEGLNESFVKVWETLKIQRELVTMLKRALAAENGVAAYREIIAEYRAEKRKKETNGLISKEDVKLALKTAKKMEELCGMAAEKAAGEVADTQKTADVQKNRPEHLQRSGQFAEALRSEFAACEDARLELSEETNKKLDRAFAFLMDTWGKGQELVIFLTGLSMNPYSSSFLLEYGNETYAALNKELLLETPGDELAREIKQVLGERQI